MHTDKCSLQQNPGFDFSGAMLKKSYDSVPASAIQRWEEKQKCAQKDGEGEGIEEGS